MKRYRATFTVEIEFKRMSLKNVKREVKYIRQEFLGHHSFGSYGESKSAKCVLEKIEDITEE